jgi:hypothetical protein
MSSQHELKDIYQYKHIMFSLSFVLSPFFLYYANQLVWLVTAFDYGDLDLT